MKYNKEYEKFNQKNPISKEMNAYCNSFFITKELDGLNKKEDMKNIIKIPKRFTKEIDKLAKLINKVEKLNKKLNKCNVELKIGIKNKVVM